MIPFESLYGRKCNTLVSWDNLADRAIIGIDLFKEMEEKMTIIKKNLKASHDKQKICADNNRFFRYFEVGEHVFLKVKEKRSFLKLGSYPKLTARYCGPFEILENIGSVAYMLAFFASMRVYIVFCVSLLNKYGAGPNHTVD
jgi:hypothetical protein